MATKRKPAARRGRPPAGIERDPQRFEIAAWWAFTGAGLGGFDAARRALLAVKGGPITFADIEGVLVQASALIPLPSHDPHDPDKGLRRLAFKAKRAKPSHWLVNSAALLQGLISFIRAGNMTGVCVSLDGLDRLGWRPVLSGLAARVEAALRSNLPPAEIGKLSPAARRLLAELRRGVK
jgi:hypothetical protein